MAPSADRGTTSSKYSTCCFACDMYVALVAGSANAAATSHPIPRAGGSPAAPPFTYASCEVPLGLSLAQVSTRDWTLLGVTSEGGGYGDDEKTEQEGYSSSRSASMAVPAVHLRASPRVFSQSVCEKGVSAHVRVCR